MFDKFYLYYHTLNHLRWTQIKYRIFYILRSKFRDWTGYMPNFKPDFNQNIQSLSLDKSITCQDIYNAKNQTFSILNINHSFKSKIDWNYPGFGKLWTYNINYFEYLHQKNLSKEHGVQLIFDFIKNIENSKDGLEPFPISLRILFWVRFLVKYNIHNAQINKSLYAQSQILLNHCEYHLLGNHLLENGFGLLHAAYYFQDGTFYSKAKKILKSELEEQILPDGAHFELTPMYHQLMLYRVLDCVNLVKNNPIIFDKELLPLLMEKAKKMCAWLKAISWQDLTIPHLNDSIDGVAPTTKELLDYAKQLGIFFKEVKLKESGYRKLRNHNFELVFDTGKIGPSYIPGHAHSDSLNILLKVKGKNVLVDTGISTYEKNRLRFSERNTQAHNTVQIKDKEQSHVWGGFRVAQRAKTKIIQDTDKNIAAIHNGYNNIDVNHKRTVNFLQGKITIIDDLKNDIEGIARFHFPNNSRLEIYENKVKSQYCIFTFSNAAKLEIKTYNLALGFNSRAKAPLLEVTFSQKLETEIILI